MQCPACLMYQVVTEAVTTVGGTALCAAHGIEALMADARQGPARRAGFTPPFTPPPPVLSAATPTVPQPQPQPQPPPQNPQSS